MLHCLDLSMAYVHSYAIPLHTGRPHHVLQFQYCTYEFFQNEFLFLHIPSADSAAPLIINVAALEVSECTAALARPIYWSHQPCT